MDPRRRAALNDDRAHSGVIGIATLGVAIVPGAVVASASLDKDTVRRVFRRQEAQIKYGYEQQLEKDRKLRGRLVVKLTIDGFRGGGTGDHPGTQMDPREGAVDRGCVSGDDD